MHYIYQEGDNFVFSDSETYEEITIPGEKLGNKSKFLVEDALCSAVFFNGTPIDITLPTWYIAVIAETEPGARGDTASSNVMKPAKIATGYELSVPAFVEAGDKIEIDTRTGEYRNRVK